MTPTPYTTVAKVEAYLLQDIDPTFAANVERWILGASRTMDDMANRKLVADAYDSDEAFELRYFDVTKYGYLTIDDCVEIEQVEQKNGDDWDVITDYDPYPAVAPFRKVVYAFPVGMQNARIRARWGFMEEITTDLEWAATVLVAGICIANQAVAGRNPGPVTKEKIGNYEVTYGSGSDNAGKAAGFRDLEEAKSIIANYRKILI
jgi:hypothetical protein